MTLLLSGRSALAAGALALIACGVSLDAVTAGGDADAGRDAAVIADAQTPDAGTPADGFLPPGCAADGWRPGATAVCNGSCSAEPDGGWRLTEHSSETTAGALWLPYAGLGPANDATTTLEIDLEVEPDTEARKVGDGFALSWLQRDTTDAQRAPETSLGYGSLGISELRDFRGQAAFVRTRGFGHDDLAGSLQLGRTPVPSPGTPDGTVEGWQAAVSENSAHYTHNAGARLRLTAVITGDRARVSMARHDVDDVQTTELTLPDTTSWLGLSASTCPFGRSGHRILAVRRCAAR